MKRKNSKEFPEEYQFSVPRKLDIKKYETIEVEANVTFLGTSKFSLKEYGFKFRDFFTFTDPMRQVKDLWGWLKKLRNLKETNSENAIVLFDLKKYLFQNFGHETYTFKSYTILKPNLAIFEIFGWATDITINTNRVSSLNKSVKITSPDLIKHVSSFILNFKFQKAIDEIRKYLNSSDNLHNKKELVFILEHIEFFAEFFSRPKPDFESFEYRVLTKCIQSIELETPYLRLVQIFLSKKFLETENIVMDIPGINFFDRLLFVLRFQYKTAQKLIMDYASKSQKIGCLDCISVYTDNEKEVKEIMGTYLENTKDIITIGLASIILFEFYDWHSLEWYIEEMLMVISSKNPDLCGTIYKEQLLLRKEIKKVNNKSKRAPPNIVYKCYFCKKELGKINANDEMVKINC